MVKQVTFLKRNPEISVEAFQHHWRTRHAALVVRLAGLRRYVQNHALDSAYREREPEFDGVAEAWFDDTDAMRALESSAEYAAVRGDEAAFVDVAAMKAVLTDEFAIVGGQGSSGAVKMIACLRKRPELAPEQFRKYWREVHGPLAAAIPGHRRYVQCPARLGIYRAGRSPAFDGVPMSWFDDDDALRAATASPEYARMRADEPNFLAPGRIPFAIVREFEIALPGR
jgi:uncharacterized protein (TIGR02118 family)